MRGEPSDLVAVAIGVRLVDRRRRSVVHIPVLSLSFTFDSAHWRGAASWSHSSVGIEMTNEGRAGGRPIDGTSRALSDRRRRSSNGMLYGGPSSFSRLSLLRIMSTDSWRRPGLALLPRVPGRGDPVAGEAELFGCQRQRLRPPEKLPESGQRSPWPAKVFARQRTEQVLQSDSTTSLQYDRAGGDRGICLRPAHGSPNESAVRLWPGTLSAATPRRVPDPQQSRRGLASRQPILKMISLGTKKRSPRI